MIPAIHEGLTAYLAAIAAFPYPGDYATASRQELIQGHLKLVVAIAKRYARHVDDLPDLIQEGNVGLIHAVDTFDRNRKFAHWASLHIRGQIRNYLFGADCLSEFARHGAPKARPVTIDDNPEVMARAVEFKPEDDVSFLVSSPAITDTQRSVLSSRLSGYSLAEIATVKGISHQAVSCLEQAAIAALKKVCK